MRTLKDSQFKPLAVQTSAKTGLGIEGVLPAVIERVPPYVLRALFVEDISNVRFESA